MEFLFIYDCKFIYVKGLDNTTADALSRYPNIDEILNTAHAENIAQHPHIGFNNRKLVVLKKDSLSPSPLNSIAFLTDANPQKNDAIPQKIKLNLSMDDDMVSKL